MRVLIFISLIFVCIQSFAQQAIYSRDRTLLISTSKNQKQQSSNILGKLDQDFPYWRDSIAGVQKETLRLDSKILDVSCTDCIESYAGMFQFKLETKSGEKLRATLHHEMKANLFRFQMMHELGYILPAQSYQPQIKLQFVNHAQKQNFIFSLKSHMGLAGQAGWKQFIEKQGDDWILIKSLLLERDWSNKIEGYHWLNLFDNQVAENKFIRRLFPLFLLSDWGEQLEINTQQFLRKKRGAILIKHPLNDFFKDVSLSELQWMAQRILKLNAPSISRSIDAMELRRDQRSILSAKVYALMNYLKEILFTKKQIEDLDLPLKATRFIVDKSINPSIVTKNWRYYIMLGVDRLGQTVLKEISKKLRLNWNKQLLKLGDETEDQIDSFFNKDSEKVVLPLSIGSFANIGLRARFSRDLVRGQFYGNTHLANMADTLRYGANASLGLDANIFGNLPMSFYQSAQIEFQEIHLRPVGSQKEAYKRFFKDLPAPLLMRKWKKRFRRNKCVFTQDMRHDCDGIVTFLDELTQDFQLDETLILSKNYSFPRGASVGVPDINILYDLNPFSGSRISWETGKVELNRISIIRTESGIRVIKTESENKFKNWVAKVNFFLPFLNWTNRRSKEKPTTKIFDIDFSFFDDERKIDAFLALKEMFLYRKTSYLEKNFSYEELKSDLLIYRTQAPLYGTDLIARKKDKASLRNELVVNHYKYDVNVQTHIKDQPRHLVLFKSVTRKFWDWLGTLEDMVNFFLPFNWKLRIRSVRDGEYAGDLRRNAKIKILTTEADLTDVNEGLYEPIVVMKEKVLEFKASRKKVAKRLKEIRLEYKEHFESISFPSLKPNLEKIKELEIAKVLVLKSILVKRIVSDLVKERSSDLLPSSSRLNRKLIRFFKKKENKTLDIGQRLGLIHLVLSVLNREYTLADLIDHFKEKGLSNEIVYDLQLKGWMYYTGEPGAKFLPYNLNPDIFRHESIFRRLIKEIGLPNYEVHGSLLVPEF